MKYSIEILENGNKVRQTFTYKGETFTYDHERVIGGCKSLHSEDFSELLEKSGKFSDEFIDKFYEIIDDNFICLDFLELYDLERS